MFIHSVIAKMHPGPVVKCYKCALFNSLRILGLINNGSNVHRVDERGLRFSWNVSCFRKNLLTLKMFYLKFLHFRVNESVQHVRGPCVTAIKMIHSIKTMEQTSL